MKKLTLILSLMIALVGLNANAAMYIVGSGPFGNWNPAGGIEMTDNGDGTYSLTTAINGSVYFVFADGLDSNWGTFNTNYRYGPANGDQNVTPATWTATSKAGDHGAYIFTGSGEDYVFTFDENNLQFRVDGYVAPIDPITGHFYVLGQVNGNNWNPMAGIEMSTLDEDVYTLTNATITDSGDGYGYFSFTSLLGAADDDWSFTAYRRGATEDGVVVVDGVSAVLADWGSSGAFKAAPAIYDIEVSLTGDYVLLTKKGDIEPEPTSDIYIMGNVNELTWDAISGVQMTYDETNEVYTAEIEVYNVENSEVGYFGFTKKLAEAESETPWDDIAAYRFGPVTEDENWAMTEELLGVDCALATDGSYHSIAIPAGTWSVTVDMVNNTFSIDGTWPTDTVTPPAPISVYTVVGPEHVFGSNWNETDEANDMVLDAETGLYTWTKNNVELTASFGFKVVGDHSWSNEWPQGFDNNWIVNIEEAGIYSLVITFDAETGDINCVATKTGDIEPVHYDGDVYILGEVNDNGGWFTNKGVLMTRNAENNIYTATITTLGENIPEGEETGYSYFSFTKQLVDSAADWDGIAPFRFGAVSDGDYWVTDEVLGTQIPLTNGGQSFRVPAGKWNLTLSVDNMTLVIEAVVEPVYTRGDVNKDGSVNITDVTKLIDYLLNNAW